MEAPGGEVAGGAGTDVAAMKQAWIDESNAPEILVYEEALVHRLLSELNRQSRRIDQLPPAQGLLKELYEMECNRIKYILRAYLRARLAKIEGLALYILSKPEQQERLSRAELDHAKRYKELFESHMQKSFLAALPEPQRRTDEVNAQVNMIPEPNLDTHVFARVKENLGDFQLEEGNDETINLQRDDIYMVRYRTLRNLLLEKKVELI